MRFFTLFILGLMLTMGGMGGLEHNGPEASVVAPTAIAFLGLILMYLATTYLNERHDYH